jgi:hypothetical protein
MAGNRKPGDAGPPERSPQEREEAARTWLGGAADGGERLARAFQIGRSARVSELEAELADLRAKLGRLEQELWTLRRDGSPRIPLAASDVPLVDLQRALPSERDYQLHRCEGFAVYAGKHPLGIVEGVRYESRTDRPDVLEVRGGRLSHRLLLVPVSDVEAIDQGDEAVIVRQAFLSPRIHERVRGYFEQLFTKRP